MKKVNKWIGLISLIGVLSAQWASAGSILKIVDLPPEMFELNSLIQEMCEKKFGEHYLKPHYPPRFTLMMIDYSNDLKTVFSEISQDYLRPDEALETLKETLLKEALKIPAPIQMNQQLAGGSLNYFRVTHMPLQQRVDFGAPESGSFDVLAFEAQPVQELSDFVAHIRAGFKEQQIILKQPNGQPMPVYSPFRLVFTSCMIRRSLQDSEKLTLSEMAEETGSQYLAKLTEIKGALRNRSYVVPKAVLEIPAQGVSYSVMFSLGTDNE